MTPIPGARRRAHLDENLGAVDIELTQDDVRRISRAIPPGMASGARYPEPQMERVNL